MYGDDDSYTGRLEMHPRFWQVECAWLLSSAVSLVFSSCVLGLLTTNRASHSKEMAGPRHSPAARRLERTCLEPDLDYPS
jgi:hypothetical protein